MLTDYSVTSEPLVGKEMLAANDRQECDALCQLESLCKCYRYIPGNAADNCSLHSKCSKQLRPEIGHEVGLYKGTRMGLLRRAGTPMLFLLHVWAAHQAVQTLVHSDVALPIA